MKPVMALVGRPNVGKSTLFNRLTKSRDAIVADFAGLTRDRHYGNARQGRYEFIVIDTGGFEPDAESGIFKEMAKQTRQAVAEADVVVFVVDARGGLSAQDHDIAKYLRRLGKPTVLAANKAEGMQEGPQLTEFYELGLGDVLPVSAAHGQGIRSLVEKAFEPLHLPEEDEDAAAEAQRAGIIKLAVAGRPNVGKSTLINTWLGEERLVAFDLPGTTRDAISVPFERNNHKFELIDTAGCDGAARFSKPSRSSPWSRHCRPSSLPMSCCCCWMRRRASRTRMRTSPATSWNRAGPWCLRSTSGMRWMTTSASRCAGRSKDDWPS